MKFRESQEAFDDAIELGCLSRVETDDNFAGNYMYMHSDSTYDYFKHITTRKYLEVKRVKDVKLS